MTWSPTRSVLPAVLLVLAALVYLVLFDRARDPRAGPSGAGTAAATAAAPPEPASAEAGSRVGGGRAEVNPAAAATTPEPQPVSAVAEEPAVLEGIVVDEQDQPVPGAWVLSSEEGEPVLTGEDGRFRMPLTASAVFDRAGRSLHVWAEGMQVLGQWVEVGDEAYLRLRTGPAVMVQVVRRGDELPIPGASVKAVVQVQPTAEDAMLDRPRWFELPAPIAPTNGNGATRVPMGECEYRVTAEGYLETVSGHDGQESSHYAGRIWLRRDADVRLRLLESDGEPFAGARVGFGSGDPDQIVDAAGWVGVPPIALARGYWVVRAVRDGQRWMTFPQEMDDERPDGPFLSGTVLTVAHFPRAGELDAGDRGSPEAFEVATAVMNRGWDNYVMPAPGEQPDLLAWTAPGPDGSFRIVDGWQGEVTALLVRERGSGRVVHQEELRGPGPYHVRLPLAGLARLRFHAEPQQRLEGALVLLQAEEGPDWAQGLEAPPVRDGVSALALEPGSYEVTLSLAGRRARFALGSFVMPAQDYEHVFELGRLQPLRGRVEAGGKPVYPCVVTIYDSHGFQLRAAVDRDGAFLAEDVPQREMKARPRPGDPWLQEVHRTERVLPLGMEEHVIRIPVGTLQFVPGDLAGIDRSRIRVQRLPLPELGRRSGSSQSPRLPALEAGTVSVRVTPSLIRFRSSEPHATVTPEEIRIEEGGIQTISLSTVALGLVEVRLRDHAGWYQASIELRDPDGLPMASDQLGLRSRGGGAPALWRHALDPGRWSLRVRGPIRQPWNRDAVPLADANALYEGEVQAVPGRTTTLWISIREDGSLAGSVTVAD